MRAGAAWASLGGAGPGNVHADVSISGKLGLTAPSGAASLKRLLEKPQRQGRVGSHRPFWGGLTEARRR